MALRSLPRGPAGLMGYGWLSDPSGQPRNPTPADGRNGDWWFNDATTVYFRKISGLWYARGKLRGNTGAPGRNGERGIGVLSGAGAPDPTTGRNGEFYYQITGGQVFIWGPKAAGAWPAAPMPSRLIIDGTGAPGPGVGVDGQLYLDRPAGVLYGPKAAGVWPAEPAGIFRVFLTGTGAPAPGVGVNGQFYIDTQNFIQYGPKALGAWPAGVSFAGAIADWTGAWAPGTYAKNQGVNHGGASFVSRVNGNTAEPTILPAPVSSAEWQLVGGSGGGSVSVAKVAGIAGLSWTGF